MKKTTQLKNLILSAKTEFIMEAHNGLSARIVEEAGFSGIWASSLTISAALGVRDENEASWTDVLSVVEYMSDASEIPILLDGDTGYGDFNSVRRLIHKLEQREIAGVCIEDKLFPKKNSFIKGESQPLCEIEEFCGKIMAAKDTHSDGDFTVIARTEAFIAGWGLTEALKRAEAYRKAGADAILVHSKRGDALDIETFMAEWAQRLPVVIVPTKYFNVPTSTFENLGISLIIWANHNLRAAINAMQVTSLTIAKEKTLLNVEPNVAPLAEVFRLTKVEELLQAETKYLPVKASPKHSIILAASQGDTLGALTQDVPKALLTVNGKTILQSILDEMNHVGIRDITVVRGFKKELIKSNNIRTVDNDNYASTTELMSLFLALENLKGDCVIAYGDVIFKSFVLNELLSDTSDVTMIADAEVELGSGYREYIKTDRPYSKLLFNHAVKLQRVSSNLSKNEISGEFIGLWKVSSRGAEIVRKSLQEMSHRKDFPTLRMSDLFNEITNISTVGVKFIKGAWVNIDTAISLQKAAGL